MGVQGTPALAQLGGSPVLDKTQSFAKGNKVNFLSSNSRPMRISHVRYLRSGPAITLPNVFSTVTNREKGMILGSLAVLVLLHFGFTVEVNRKGNLYRFLHEVCFEAAGLSLLDK